MHMNWGLYNHSMTVSTISMLSTQTSSELTVVVVFLCVWVFLFFVFTELSLLVDHHKPKHTLKMCYCCVKVKVTVMVQNSVYCLSVRHLLNR